MSIEYKHGKEKVKNTYSFFICLNARMHIIFDADGKVYDEKQEEVSSELK